MASQQMSSGTAPEKKKGGEERGGNNPQLVPGTVMHGHLYQPHPRPVVQRR